MGCYSELDHQLQIIYKQQERVYPDSVDIGIRISSLDAPVCKHIRMLLADPIMAGGLHHHRQERHDNVHTQVSITLYLPWENSEIGDGFRCSSWSIMFYYDKRRNVRFVSVHPGMANPVLGTDIWEE